MRRVPQEKARVFPISQDKAFKLVIASAIKSSDNPLKMIQPMSFTGNGPALHSPLVIYDSFEVC